MIVSFRNKRVLPIFFMVLFALFVVGCNNTKPVERLPAEQIAGEPDEPLLISPEPKNTGSNAGLALNPAHGQPGHRCDVQVGAPLSTTSQAANPSVLESVNKSAVIGGTAALNPAHGQPGHRCDVRVGSPL
jgi:hypothetical protein